MPDTTTQTTSNVDQTVEELATVAVEAGVTVSEIKSTLSTGRTLFTAEPLTTARVGSPDGTVAYVSRYDDEEPGQWVIDSIFTANGTPIASRGEGSRLTPWLQLLAPAAAALVTHTAQQNQENQA